METKSNVLTTDDFFENLQQGKLDTLLPFSIIGIVKKSEGELKTFEFAPGGNCSNWVTIPLEFVEDVEMIKTLSCKDHSHPLVKLNMKTPKTPEGKVFFALLKGMQQGLENMQQSQNLKQRVYHDADIEPILPVSLARLRSGMFGGFGGFRAGLDFVATADKCPANTLATWSCINNVCGWVCSTY